MRHNSDTMANNLNIAPQDSIFLRKTVDSGFVLTNTTQFGAEVDAINKEAGSGLYMHRKKDMKSRLRENMYKKSRSPSNLKIDR